ILDVAIDKTHVGGFTSGTQGVYTITIANTGTIPTAGTITVTDTLPAGLSYVSTSGAGWTFSVSGQVVTALYTPSVPAGQNRSFTITVLADPSAVPGLVNTAYASLAGDVVPANDRDSDPTVVSP